MSATAADFLNTGRLDLYVANDAMESYFLRNLGKGKFASDGLPFGLAFGEGGQGVSSMGPVFGDVDRDGRLDLYIPDMGYGCLHVNQRRVLRGPDQRLGAGADLRPVHRLGRGAPGLRQRRLPRPVRRQRRCPPRVRRGGRDGPQQRQGQVRRRGQPVGPLLRPEVRGPGRHLGRLRQRRRRRPPDRQPQRLAAAAPQRRRQHDEPLADGRAPGSRAARPTPSAPASRSRPARSCRSTT